MKTCRKGLHNFEGQRCKECAAEYENSSERRKLKKRNRLNFLAVHPTYARDWQLNNREKGRAYSYKYVGNKPHYPSPGFCESCGSITVAGQKGNKACSDHDHDTGLWRGWLCHKCNILEGYLKKIDANTQDVQSLRDYLARKKAKSVA